MGDAIPISRDESAGGFTDGVIIHETERLKIAQAVYNAVTGKAEKLSKIFSESYKLDKNGIDQLHRKLDQLCGQWYVSQKSTRIIIQHVDDNKEEFNSFEKFTLYDASRNSPTETVTYELNLLIKLPNIDLLQHYKITVRILSRLALEKKMEDNIPPGPIFRFLSTGPIIAEVEYVDYVVARTIISAIDSWVGEVEIAKDHEIIKFCQRWSHWIPRLAQVGIPLLGFFMIFSLADSYVTVSLVSGVKYVIAALTFLWVTAYISNILGRSAEMAVDNIIPLSYIMLNKGDEKLLECHQSRKKWCLSKIIGNVALLIGQAVFLRFCSDKILSYLFGKH